MVKDFPIKMEVKFLPNTGSKRPFELWSFWNGGRCRNVGSYASEEAAIKNRDIRWARIEEAKKKEG